MYLLELISENALHHGSDTFRVQEREDGPSIPKFTLLKGDPAAREFLSLITIGIGGAPFLNAIGIREGLTRDPQQPLKVMCRIARHKGLDRANQVGVQIGIGSQVNEDGCVTPIPAKDIDRFTAGIPRRVLRFKTRVSCYFFLGYGEHYATAGLARADFDFSDPLYRSKRFHSIFQPGAALTHPADFIQRLRYKGFKRGRTRSKEILHALCAQLSLHLHIDTSSWPNTETSAEKAWAKLLSWQQRAALPILDMARHMMDAFPRSGKPLEMPGVVVIDRPDIMCAPASVGSYLTMLDRLFPAQQFFVSLDPAIANPLPSAVRNERLTLPQAEAPVRKMRTTQLSRDTVLLLDVDGRLPNLALMKLSTFFRQKGHPVYLGRNDCCIKGPDQVYASVLVFSPSSRKRMQRLRSFYGDRLTIGGSGADLVSRLPESVECLQPDYKLYPELGDRAIGFITRGCPFTCPFCVVPQKEGKPRQVSDLGAMLEGTRRDKLILLDDNILSHPDADRFLSEIADRSIQVNFTQTLDLRLVNRERAQLLRRICCANTRFTRRCYHFSLNNDRNLDLVRKKYSLFDFKASDNVEFVCMYGFDTTLAEDVRRFSFLRSLPGAYVFMQEYLPPRGGPSPRSLDFFGHDPDEQLDRLIKIVFTQNMKSMEKYYRWVSRRYADTYGKLHMGLVDTIFRYNRRQERGDYIASLARTRKNPR